MILRKYVHEKFNTPTDKPINLVFHGGSGSTEQEIRESVSYGVIKMNIDTDTRTSQLTTDFKEFVLEWYVLAGFPFEWVLGFSVRVQ